MKLDMHYYGDPVLRAPAARVEAVTDELRQLAAAMIEAMHTENGVGLAAPQIGRSVALCVVELPVDYDTTEDGRRLNPDVEMPLVLINPEIVSIGRKTDVHEEGCLSFPGLRGNIERPIDITVRYLGLDGQPRARAFTDFLARVIQHEVDHLNGVLFIDRMSAAKRFALKGRLRKLENETRERLGLA
ncbi:MAG TPA: peptide deformylase [Kiritimatiellia bacterium]|nr:peptide deformylase [Kiritimatiellia bacterium]